MRKILVTGANKGIGLAIAQAILEEGDDTFVFLGSRDRARGEAAAAGLVEGHPAWKARVEVVPIDVASEASVASARTHVEGRLAGEKLYGIVNNAGIATGNGEKMAAVLEVNVFGMRRVCEAFLPLLDPQGGRVVNVTSAAGPNFVAACSPERQAFLLDANNEWPQLEALAKECLALGDDEAAFAKKGLGKGEAYGLSKALANAYTLLLARKHPALHVNACTPGFIETDLTHHFTKSQGKSAAELGMKPPREGAKAPRHLLFDALEGNGRYYGSDAQRSPLDRYRSPGSPPYTGA